MIEDKWKEFIVDENKKVTVKFIMDDRIKGIDFHGKMHYPVYARVTFLRKNTMIKVVDKENNTLYLPKEAFQNINANNFIQRNLPVEINALLVYKSFFISSAIELEFFHKKEKFDFKEFTKKLKILEKNTIYFLYERFLEEANQVSLKLIDDYYFCSKLDVQMIFRNDKSTFEWIGKIGKDRISSEYLFLLGKSLVALSLFEYNYGHLKARNSPSATSIIGNIYSWVHTREYSNKFLESRKAINTSKTDQFFSKIMLEIFTPDPGEYEDYQKCISTEIKNVLL